MKPIHLLYLTCTLTWLRIWYSDCYPNESELERGLHRNYFDNKSFWQGKSLLLYTSLVSSCWTLWLWVWVVEFRSPYLKLSHNVPYRENYLKQFTVEWVIWSGILLWGLLPNLNCQLFLCVFLPHYVKFMFLGQI